MPTGPRPGVDELALCPHGAIGDAEIKALGIERVIDFSVNGNPLGPSPAVREAIARVDPARYPDSEGLGLRRALAARLDVRVDQIAVGNGSAELIWLLAEAYLRPGDRVVITGPTFGEYARATRIHSGEPVFVEAREDEGFRLDVARAERAIREVRPRLVFLCNPNNPTGLYLGAKTVRRLAQAAADGLLIVDEAYLSFVKEPDTALLAGDNVVNLRSMTKDYALAGLRLGYAVVHEDVALALRKVQPPWSVNALALAAGRAALADEAHLARARDVVDEMKCYLTGELRRLGLTVIPSAANFFLVKVGEGSRFRAALLARGCCVRDCASFGLPQFARIGLRPLSECRRLVEAVEEVVGER